jgi:uncharacterized membrane protein
VVPFFTLVLGSLVARLVGWLGVDYVDGWPAAVAVGLAAMFVMTGVAHFVQPLRGAMIAIVPPRLPAAALLVTVTGVLELLGVIGLLIPVTRVAAAGCLFLLMLVMFPANVYASRMPNPPKSMNPRLGVRSAQQIAYLAAAVVVAVGGSQ